MPWGTYGRGRGFGARGRGRGLGNPHPFCRFYPWLPRGWWRYGSAPYGGHPDYGRRSYGWGPSRTPYGPPVDDPYAYRPRWSRR